MGNFDDFSREKNPFFNFRGSSYDMERKYFSSVITEAINKFGVCLQFYETSYDVKYNPIFGEDSNRRFVRYFDFMGYYMLPKEEKLFTKFGITGLDNFSIVVSKKHFKFVSTNPTTGLEYIPKIGDILRSKYSNHFYEIVEVVEEVNVILQSKQHVWEFVVRVYKDENISLTGETSATELSASTNKLNDIFNIKNEIDIRKENIIYKPTPTEKPSQDPWKAY